MDEAGKPQTAVAESDIEKQDTVIPSIETPRKMQDFQGWSKDALKKHAVVLQNMVDVIEAREKQEKDEADDEIVSISVYRGSERVFNSECRRGDYGFGHTDAGIQILVKGDISVFTGEFEMHVDKVKVKDGPEK